jgi:hypothetical protein
VVEISQFRRENERFGPFLRFSLFFVLYGKNRSGAGGGAGGWTDLCARRFCVSLPFPLLGRRLLPLLRGSKRCWLRLWLCRHRRRRRRHRCVRVRLLLLLLLEEQLLLLRGHLLLLLLLHATENGSGQ